MGAPKHHSLICGVRVLKNAPHFRFHLVDQPLGVVNLFFYFARSAEQRAEFTRAPTGKSGLVLALEMVPSGTDPVQARHRGSAIRGHDFAQWLLVKQDEDGAA